MTKMQKFIPMAKKLEEIQDQAEMVSSSNTLPFSIFFTTNKYAETQLSDINEDKYRVFLKKVLHKREEKMREKIEMT